MGKLSRFPCPANSAIVSALSDAPDNNRIDGDAVTRARHAKRYAL